MSINSNAKVGMVVVVALLIFGVITVEMGVWKKNVDTGVCYYIVFDNVSGLLPGAAVLKAGVNVGKVDNLTIISAAEPVSLRDKVRVTLKIRNPQEVLTAESVYMVSTNLMGDRWLEISPRRGRRLNHVTDYNAPWKNDYTRGISPVTMDQLMIQAEEAISQMQSAADSLNKIVGDPKVQQDIKDSINAISELSKSLKTLTANANQSMTKVVGKMENVMDGADSVLASTDRLLISSRVKMESLLTNIDGVVTDNKEDLRTIVKNMSDTSHTLKQAMGSVQKIADDPQFGTSILDTLDNISKLSGELNGMASDLHSLTSDPELKENLKATISETKETITGVKEIVNKIRGKKGAGLFNGRFAQLDLDSQIYTPNGEMRGDANLHLLPDSSSGLKIGVDDIGLNNYFNLQYSKRYGWIRPRAGIVRSKLGLGVDALVGKNLELSVDTYNTSDLQTDLMGKYIFHNGFYLTGGVRDLFDKKQGVIGIGKRF